MLHISSVNLLIMLSNFLMFGLENETAGMRMECGV